MNKGKKEITLEMVEAMTDKSELIEVLCRVTQEAEEYQEQTLMIQAETLRIKAQTQATELQTQAAQLQIAAIQQELQTAKAGNPAAFDEL